MATSFWVDLPVVSTSFPVSIDVTQGTIPWADNITQFGSNNVATGLGASGLGIPRVTISNDSNILATQSGTWNIVNISGAISLPTGASTSAIQTTNDNRFFSTTATVAQVASSATNVILLASNAGRKGAIFFNNSAQSCYVKLGVTASTASFTIKMDPASTLIINNDPVYTGEIDGIWDSADGVMAVTELT